MAQISHYTDIAIDEGKPFDKHDSILKSEITVDQLITSMYKLKGGTSQGIDSHGAKSY